MMQLHEVVMIFAKVMDGLIDAKVPGINAMPIIPSGQPRPAVPARLPLLFPVQGEKLRACATPVPFHRD
jgi:hypothetical protein